MTETEGVMERGFDYSLAVAEANRCLLCEDAPCSKGCPAKTEPAEFIRKLRFSNVTGAIRTIKENNVLGGACGILCPTHRLCEKECSASGIDRPIRIGKIQRFLVEHGWKLGFSPLSAGRSTGRKVAVVGGGPAGLSCAAELAQRGHAVTVLEGRARAGGVLAFGVPDYRFDAAFLEREIEDVRHLGVEIRTNHPVEGAGAVEKLLEAGFDAVFVAPGCWEAVRLSTTPAPRGVLPSTGFLPALRDGRREEMKKLVAGRTVAVLGGGSVAMDCAGAAAHLGAAEVYLVYRRSWAEMPAEEDERIETMHRGVHFLVLNAPLGWVEGAKGLEGLRIVRTRLGEPDPSGRRRPIEIPGSEFVLPVDVGIEALGSRPAAASPSWYPSLSRREGDLLAADKTTGVTSHPAIFAGGDIVRGPALVVQAVRDGKVAAEAIDKYLAGKAARESGGAR